MLIKQCMKRIIFLTFLFLSIGLSAQESKLVIESSLLPNQTFENGDSLHVLKIRYQIDTVKLDSVSVKLLSGEVIQVNQTLRISSINTDSSSAVFYSNGDIVLQDITRSMFIPVHLEIILFYKDHSIETFTQDL